MITRLTTLLSHTAQQTVFTIHTPNSLQYLEEWLKSEFDIDDLLSCLSSLMSERAREHSHA